MISEELVKNLLCGKSVKILLRSGERYNVVYGVIGGCLDSTLILKHGERSELISLSTIEWIYELKPEEKKA